MRIHLHICLLAQRSETRVLNISVLGQLCQTYMQAPRQKHPCRIAMFSPGHCVPNTLCRRRRDAFPQLCLPRGNCPQVVKEATSKYGQAPASAAAKGKPPPRARKV